MESQENNLMLLFILMACLLSTFTPSANKLLDFIPVKACFHLVNYALHSEPFISEFDIKGVSLVQM